MNRRQPEAPTNVQAWTKDRTRSIPLDCAYDGWRNNCHYWVVVTRFDPQIYTSITIEEMPGRTSIQVIFDRGDTTISSIEGWE